MAHKITIKYVAPVMDEARKCATICRMFHPAECYADMEVMEARNTNVPGMGGPVMPILEYLAAQVAHPGLIAACKQAVKDGEYVIEEADEKVYLYCKEVENALAAEGFTFVFE